MTRTARGPASCATRSPASRDQQDRAALTYLAEPGRSRARGPAGRLRTRRGTGRDQGGLAAAGLAARRGQPGPAARAGGRAWPLAAPAAVAARRRRPRGRSPRRHPAGLPRRSGMAGRPGRAGPGPPVCAMATRPREPARNVRTLGLDRGLPCRHRVRRSRGGRDRRRSRRARMGGDLGRRVRHRRRRPPRRAGHRGYDHRRVSPRGSDHRRPGLRCRLLLSRGSREPVCGHRGPGPGHQRMAARPSARSPKVPRPQQDDRRAIRRHGNRRGE